MESIEYARIKDWYISASTRRLVGFVSTDLAGNDYHKFRTVTSPVIDLNEKEGYAVTHTTHYLLGAHK